jgi:uncharacterized NAD(P)/FAD-binding protein YdhS
VTRRVAIVGAGLSGRLLALNLLRQAGPDDALLIRMYDRSDERSMGPAYSDEAPYLLLNVPAGRMGAFSEDPAHFLEWARAHGVAAGETSFLSRTLYRDYVLELLDDARRAHEASARLEHVRADVTAVDPQGAGVRIAADGVEPFEADAAVLALGNFPPRHPRLDDPQALSSPRYARDPWRSAALDALAPDDTVVSIGTGQTTVDLVVKLHHRGHRGRIVALSRRGLLPLTHAGFDDYPSCAAEIEGLGSLAAALHVVRQHLKRAEELGIDGRAVIDALRPDTQRLWRGLPESEKRRFLRHLGRYWEVVRSRIPPASAAVVDSLRATGQLEIVAGRLTGLVDRGTTLEARFRRAGSGAPERVRGGARRQLHGAGVRVRADRRSARARPPGEGTDPARAGGARPRCALGRRRRRARRRGLRGPVHPRLDDERRPLGGAGRARDQSAGRTARPTVARAPRRDVRAERARVLIVAARPSLVSDCVIVSGAQAARA